MNWQIQMLLSSYLQLYQVCVIHIILHGDDQVQMHLQPYLKHLHQKLYNIFIVSCMKLLFNKVFKFESFLFSESDCIQKTLESIDDNSALNLIEKTDVLFTLLTMLKDSSKLCQILIDDFRSTGYRIISDVILK